MVARIALSWNCLRDENRGLSLKDATEDTPDNLIHNIPGARISGLGTFPRTFQRHNSGENPVAEEISNFQTVGSFDEEYHQQVREIHKNTSASDLTPVASGNRGESVFAEV